MNAFRANNAEDVILVDDGGGGEELKVKNQCQLSRFIAVSANCINSKRKAREWYGFRTWSSLSWHAGIRLVVDTSDG